MWLIVNVKQMVFSQINYLGFFRNGNQIQHAKIQKEGVFKKSAIRSAIEFFINSLLMSKITQNTQGFDFRLFNLKKS
jgi:hypothetical protein